MEKKEFKIDFGCIRVAGVDGQPIMLDVRKPLGNKMYMQGADIAAIDLAREIYYSEGEMTLTEAQAAAVIQSVQDYPYVTRTAIEEILK